ncbi:MAG: gamma carbonic anhydrase family protein [Rhodocyclaceae bacterium]|nr:gamma carbonic anhydrase family protein [Rhodocyclaceae bacterium]MBX3669635.1 gamma carbonic anhydrase family protein [Rhodocyclaceae bacterium]
MDAKTVYLREFGTPRFDASNTYVSDRATLMGDVELGAYSNIWPSAVVRGDGGGWVRIGTHCNVQDGAVIHGGEPAFCVQIGNFVTIAHCAMVHGGSIGDYVCIGIGAIVLDGSHIPSETIIGAGAVVSPGKKLEPGYIYMGAPAKPIRALSDKDREWLRYNASLYVGLGQKAITPDVITPPPASTGPQRVRF